MFWRKRICIDEVVAALGRIHGFDEASDLPPDVFDGAPLGNSHPVFDLGEGPSMGLRSGE